MCHQLSLQERDRLAQLRGDGASQKEIAVVLRRSPSTISREIHRNRTDDEYLPGQAHRLAECRRRERPLERKMDDPDINRDVRAGLAQEWSPEQIAGRLKFAHPDDTERHVSPQTIYTWIDNDESADHWRDQLRRRGKRPARKKTAPDSDAARIQDRPDVIEQRLRLGDFEGDTVLGPPGTGGLATLVDRKSRFSIVTKIQSKDANHVHSKLKQRLQELDESRRQSITFDNGTEFARCHRLEKHLGIELYYADPGCPYQRGTNENTNGLIRQYFPKGTKFHDITHAEVRAVENRLNRRPRKCLGYRTPEEVFYAKTAPVNCD
jgi:transposase, IS30 family